MKGIDMGVLELQQWQWSGYARYHGSRANLKIHIAVIPLLLVGNAVARIGLEQWMTLLRFVFCGGWLRAWRQQTQWRASATP
ncbi:MAG: hypothetical protein Q7T13_19415 [Polaromonas sp.]|nr:hypothetical protein [Polaromonas sp.]